MPTEVHKAIVLLLVHLRKY